MLILILTSRHNVAHKCLSTFICLFFFPAIKNTLICIMEHGVICKYQRWLNFHQLVSPGTVDVTSGWENFVDHCFFFHEGK